MNTPRTAGALARERRTTTMNETNPTLLDGVRIGFGFPIWLRPFIRPGVAGITIGRRVWLDPSVASLPRERQVAVLAHELAHVNQYRRHGRIAFLARYLFEYLRNRVRGLDRYDAYREISFEKEAFAEEWERGGDRA